MKSYRSQLQSFFIASSLAVFSLGYGLEEGGGNRPCKETCFSRLSARYRSLKGVGYTKGYTTLEGFVTPGGVKEWQPFFNLRGHMFNNGKAGANIGGGFRYQVDSSWILGCNAFYDYRQDMGPFHQVGIGLEGFHSHFDLRVNAYIPFASMKKYGPKSFFIDQQLYSQRDATFSLPSIYGEIGVPLLFSPVELYLAVGPYYLFSRSATCQRYSGSGGGKARFSLKIFDGITFGADYTYDSIYRSNIQGHISLSFPTTPANMIRGGTRWKKNYPGKCHSDAVHIARMTQNVERNEIIPLRSEQPICEELDQNGNRYHFMIVSNNGKVPIELLRKDHGSFALGSLAHPFLSLEEASKESKPNDIFLIFPGDRTSKGIESGITLLEGQKVFGSAVELPLHKVTFAPFTPGVYPVMTNTYDRPVITLSTGGRGGHEVAGLSLRMDGKYEDHEVGGISLENSIPAIAFAKDGIARGTHIIRDNKFIGGGIHLSAGNDASIHVERNEFTTQKGKAIALEGREGFQFLVANNTVLFQESGRIEGAISVIANDGVGTIAHNSVRGAENRTFQDGIKVDLRGSGVVDFIGNRVVGGTRGGIVAFVENGSAVTFVQNRVEQNGSEGIVLIGSDRIKALFKENRVEGNKEKGIYVLGRRSVIDGGEITFEGNIIDAQKGATGIVLSNLTNVKVASDNNKITGLGKGVDVTSFTGGMLSLKDNVIGSAGQSVGVTINVDESVIYGVDNTIEGSFAIKADNLEGITTVRLNRNTITGKESSLSLMNLSEQGFKVETTGGSRGGFESENGDVQSFEYGEGVEFTLSDGSEMTPVHVIREKDAFEKSRREELKAILPELKERKRQLNPVVGKEVGKPKESTLPAEKREVQEVVPAVVAEEIVEEKGKESTLPAEKREVQEVVLAVAAEEIVEEKGKESTLPPEKKEVQEVVQGAPIVEVEDPLFEGYFLLGDGKKKSKSENENEAAGNETLDNLLLGEEKKKPEEEKQIPRVEKVENLEDLWSRMTPQEKQAVESGVATVEIGEKKLSDHWAGWLATFIGMKDGPIYRLRFKTEEDMKKFQAENEGYKRINKKGDQI